MDGIELGKRPFYAHFKDTEKYPNYTACRVLNGNLAVAYWKAGNISAIKPHLSQVIFDGFNAPRNYYGETWCHRHIFWVTYTAGASADYKFIPPWYELHATAFPDQATRDARFLLKRYFCTIHGFNKYFHNANDINSVKNIINKNFSKKAAEEVEKYKTEVLDPLHATEKTIMGRNIGTEVNLRAITIENITLYKNALKHVRRLGLDQVIYNGEPVFVSHINSLISEAEAELKRHSH